MWGQRKHEPEAIAEYLRPYRDAARACGAGFESLLWHSRAYQQVRFQVLIESVRASICAGHATRRDPLGGRIVVDLGCGRADLALYLRQEGVEIGRYIGVEAVGELAEASRATIAAIPEPRPDAVIIEADFAADGAVIERLAASGGEVFILSGSLNTMTQAMALGVLERAWRAIARVRRGVLAFNFLSNQFGTAGLSAPIPGMAGARVKARGGSTDVVRPEESSPLRRPRKASATPPPHAGEEGGDAGGPEVADDAGRPDPGSDPDPGPDFDGPARRFDTRAIIDWALARSGSVIIRHDYLGGRDCTIVMGAEG